jgi:hypothetical protein
MSSRELARVSASLRWVMLSAICDSEYLSMISILISFVPHLWKKYIHTSYHFIVVEADRIFLQTPTLYQNKLTIYLFMAYHLRYIIIYIINLQYYTISY